MDIRSFFGSAGNKKTGKSPAKQDEKSKQSSQNKGSPVKKVKSSTAIKKVSEEKNRNGKDTKGKNSDSARKTIVIDIDSDTDFNENNTGNVKTKKKIESTGGVKHSKNGNQKRKPSSDDEEEVKSIKSKAKHKNKRVLDSDSDEDSLRNKPAVKERKSSGKLKRVVVLDSDDEKPRKSTLDAFLKTPSPKKHVPQKKAESTENKTPVNFKDFFGGSSVKRIERSTAASKRKLDDANDAEEKDSVIDVDMEMHDDEDFIKTLDQTNGTKAKRARVSSTPEKELELKKEEKSSLASKLSVKASKTLVSDTPEKKTEETYVPDTPAYNKKPSPKKSPNKVKVEFTSKKSTAIESAAVLKSLESKVPQTKTKTSPSKTSPDTPASLRRGNSNYRSYMTREGPRTLGAKEVPQGADNCLEGLTFVITGVQESFERDELKQIIEKYGGKVTITVSKKTTYLVTGRDSGESKIRKAESLGTKQIDEDGILNLIRTLPGKKSKFEIQAQASIKKEKSMQKKSEEVADNPAQPNWLSKFERVSFPSKSVSQPASQDSMASSQSSVQSVSPKKNTDQSQQGLLWVDKYKPTTMKQIIGQQGDRSNAKKLLHWLTNWHKNRELGTKPQGRFFNKNDDGSGYRAALLSGPPGIGKTTTATLVCQEAGFSYVELNASDTRSKKSLKEIVSQSLGNTTMVDYIGGGSSKTQGRKHCLLMDEVDGMAGNEDRGGLNELVQLIKISHIPVICMCNDRNHQKMRTLSNYTYDLRFQKPRVDQIKGAMMSLAFREGLKISPPALNEIILGANQDIRQVIHNLSMWTAGEKAITYEQAKKDSSSAKKDFKIGPFDVCRKVFVGGEETAGMTINDKSDLFFHDYSLAPLFVQENYISVIPFEARGNVTKHLSLLARAASSLSQSDLVDRQIRSGQNWSLLPTAAMYASVIPGEYMRGSFPQMVNFPSWLGKNSTQGKHDRILQELRTHMRLKTSADKRSLNMDYLPFMRQSLTEPLVQREGDGVPEVIQMMDEYDIIKEDFDSIMEVTKWPNSNDPMAKLSPKTKAAFTRAYNKEVHMTPYATGVMSKKKKKGDAGVDDLQELGEEGTEAVVESEEEEDGLENDTMIKQSKKKPDSKSTGKGKGSESGKGKGKGRSSESSKGRGKS